MKLIFLSLIVIIFILTISNNATTIDHFTNLPPELSKTIDTINKEIELQSNNIDSVDLKKYILKTEIPVCPKQLSINDYIKKNTLPDMSKYILKTQLPVCPKQIDLKNYIKKKTLPDMSKYILKTQIPVCPKIPDLSKFVLKSSVPPPKNCRKYSKLNNTIDSLSISNINKTSCKKL